jgi:uncharacterized membrane protein
MSTDILTDLREFVWVTKLHPVLVDFTAALVPVSVGSDCAARLLRKDALGETAWWCLAYAVFITPFTALSGWLFWMKDDTGSNGMAVHKWLGTSMVLLLAGLFAWRSRFRARAQAVSGAYMALGLLLVALLVYQGYLGGVQVFSGMN